MNYLNLYTICGGMSRWLIRIDMECTVLPMVLCTIKILKSFETKVGHSPVIFNRVIYAGYVIVYIELSLSLLKHQHPMMNHAPHSMYYVEKEH